jgi:hypothetical protein
MFIHHCPYNGAVKYVPSMMVGQLSKSAGSTTASRNRFGSYFRNRATPVNPRTAPQTAQRTALNDASTGWKALTTTQRLQWKQLGAQLTRTDTLGQSYTMTGLQAYVSAFRVARVQGQTPISSPPATPTSFAGIQFVTPTATAGTPTFSLAYGPSPVPTGQQYRVEAGPQISAGINFVPRSYYRVIASVAAAGATPFDALAAYTGRFGPLVAGAKIFVRMTPVDIAGMQIGTPKETLVIVGA